MGKRRKRPAGKTKPGRRPARRKSAVMGLTKKLLLAAVIFIVAAVMAFRGCPRSRGGRERHVHSSRAEHLFSFSVKKGTEKSAARRA